MRITLALATVATLVAATSILSTPAAATDGRGAIRACDGNAKNCTFTVDAAGGVDLQIKQSDGTTSNVSCPPKGACVCVTCKTTGGRKGGKIDPIKVINASSPKTPAKTGTTTRDHRGAKGAAEGGVTVNGKKTTVGQGQAPKLGGPKNKGGYAGLGGSGSEKGQSGGVTVRDHRK